VGVNWALINRTTKHNGMVHGFRAVIVVLSLHLKGILKDSFLGLEGQMLGLDLESQILGIQKCIYPGFPLPSYCNVSAAVKSYHV